MITYATVIGALQGVALVGLGLVVVCAVDDFRQSRRKVTLVQRSALLWYATYADAPDGRWGVGETPENAVADLRRG